MCVLPIILGSGILKETENEYITQSNLTNQLFLLLFFRFKYTRVCMCAWNPWMRIECCILILIYYCINLFKCNEISLKRMKAKLMLTLDIQSFVSQWHICSLLLNVLINRRNVSCYRFQQQFIYIPCTFLIHCLQIKNRKEICTLNFYIESLTRSWIQEGDLLPIKKFTVCSSY